MTIFRLWRLPERPFFEGDIVHGPLAGRDLSQGGQQAVHHKVGPPFSYFSGLGPFAERPVPDPPPIWRHRAPAQALGAAPEEEALGPETAAEEEEAPKDKAILNNPKWEVEKVGFNEATDISVEAQLPEAEAHKTKVAFELFAKKASPTKSKRIIPCGEAMRSRSMSA